MVKQLNIRLLRGKCWTGRKSWDRRAWDQVASAPRDLVSSRILDTYRTNWPILRPNPVSGNRSVIGNQNATISRSIGARSPDKDIAEHIAWLADVDDEGADIQDLIGDVVEDERLADGKVIDVILHGGGGMGDGGLLICSGGAGFQGDDGRQGNADQVWIEGGSGKRKGDILLDGGLNRLE